MQDLLLPLGSSYGSQKIGGGQVGFYQACDWSEINILCSLWHLFSSPWPLKKSVEHWNNIESTKDGFILTLIVCQLFF